MLGARVPTSPTPMFPLHSLLGYLAMLGDRPNILKYITAAKESADVGLIKKDAGSSLTFSPDESSLAGLKDSNYITRLEPLFHNFSEGIKLLPAEGIALRDVRSFVLQSGHTRIEIQVSMCVESSGVPCVSWITYCDRNAHYDNIRVRNGMESQEYVPNEDTSDEKDPFLVAAHLAIGLHQLKMRDDGLIAPHHTPFIVCRPRTAVVE